MTGNAGAAEDKPAVTSSGAKIPLHRRYALCRELAKGERTRTVLAREFGVTSSAITKFARVNAARIEQIRAAIDSEFAGLWLADKTQRIASYEADLELSGEGERAGHFEQIRTRTEIRKAVAEELGQLPTRGVQVTGTVTHILEGIDVDDLR
jgi:hypothetical protein